MSEPVLSICVPSRNRQVYFQETIKSLLACQRDDVEFVLADNSDDPAIMDGFMEQHRGDRRIRYLPSADKTLPMMDNWERALCAATGRFVSFIGDDDFLDPELAGFLVNLEKTVDADAVAWTGPNYTWPTPNSAPHSITISLKTHVTQFQKRLLMRKAFMWEGCHHVPLAGFSIYHGALSRRLLDKVRKMGSGRYFEFPIIDYEMAFKAILLGETFIHVARPFSVLGACPLSSSATIGRVEEEAKNQAKFFRELGRDMNDDECFKDTPFRTWHGLTACIYLIQHWLGHKYGLKQEGYEQNLVKAFAVNCSLFRDRADFDLVSERYRVAIESWKGGTYLEYFNPVFWGTGAARPELTFSGLTSEQDLVFPDNIGDVRTPGELFHLFSDVLVRPEEIVVDLSVKVRPELVNMDAA